MLDDTDKQILNELSRNSRISMRALGEKIHLTGQATASRVQRLEDNRVIENYTVKVNHAKLNCYIHAFITVHLINPNHQPFLAFVQAQDQFVMNFYRVSGEGCYILECRFPSNEYVDRFLVAMNEYANYKLSIVINNQPLSNTDS